MKKNNRFLIKTESGFKNFLGLRRTQNTGLIIKTNKSEIRCTLEHRILVGKSKSGKIFRQAKYLKIGDRIKKQKIIFIDNDVSKKFYYDPISVEDCNSYLSSEITHHNCAVIDEAAFVRSTQWHLFLDAFLPSQSALSWKKNLILSTPKGMNHFYEIVKGASPTEFNSSGSGIKERGDTGFTLFKVDWRDVPRYDSKGNNISPEDFKDKIIRKHGAQYWAQNFACEFLGSSHTLIKSEILKEMSSIEPEEIRDGKLKIYSYPEKGHKYIFTVDPSMGIQGDFFAIQIIDITTINFKQVASARLNEDYLKLPIFLNDWGRYYNDALMIIENNTGSGQSIADILYQTFEYENLYFDKESKDKKRKKYPGFRTTIKSRKMILDNLKMFIENRKFEINDKDTIKEFFTFILINDKFQADDGFHDDMIMSLALCFAIFMDTNNFDDVSKIIESMYNDEMQNDNFSDYLTIGNFDDGTEIEIKQNCRYWNGFEVIESQEGFY